MGSRRVPARLSVLSSVLQKETISMVALSTADLTVVSSGESHVNEGEWLTSIKKGRSWWSNITSKPSTWLGLGEGCGWREGCG